ncbi:asparagine synthase-domain-containing protein [Lanmaoa asiatica]|nr:asparagine synthase-domain-containing protein [Lanmaoa asiatica]
MCGIFCSLRTSYKQEYTSADEDAFRIMSDKLKRANAARGPDARHGTSIGFPPCNAAGSSDSEISRGHILEFYASELRLRGNAPIVQPHMEGGDVLCWNGEVRQSVMNVIRVGADRSLYVFTAIRADHPKIGPAENDGQKVFERFRAAIEPFSISEIIGNIEGPLSYPLQGSSKKLYFARDPLGRRSLLIHKPTLTNPIFLLASVSAGDDDAYEFEELSTDGIFGLDLGTLREPENFVTNFHSNFVVIPRASGEHMGFGVIRKVNQSLPPDNLPRIQGLDAISLPTPLLEAMGQLIYQLDRSVMLRVRDIPQAPGGGGNAKVAVLFSGGIDSTMLAFLAHRHISLDEPIDLLNVAFENPRKIQLQLDGNIGALPKKKRKQHSKTVETDSSGNTDKELSSYMVPDRVTGLQEVEELRRLCPGRVWNFVSLATESYTFRAARSAVEAMMYPSKTVMDLSLALALYFASRGIGRVRDTPTSRYRLYTSPAKVLVSGLGSDEMLGGYSRHRSVFTARGWQGVIDELQLELDRIPTRNLGRDDRIISSHGKETRHPFLSLSVVSFLAGLPVHLKLDPRMDIGIGDKILLRLAARKVGLVEASVRKKRAMQFGSHSARMEGVPLGIAFAAVQASIYDVPGGFRAVMFDRFSGVKDKATGEGTHLLVPWLQRAILYDCRTKPRNISTTTGSKDLQMVSITLRVLSRPDTDHLPKIYQSLGLDYDERVLPSIGNEVLKAIVAQFDAAELITQREVVSSRIRADLLQRAGEFNLKLEDVSITHLTFGKVGPLEARQNYAERAKFIVEKAEQERQAAVIRAEGEAEAAATVSKALEKAGDAFLALRKIEASKAIVQSLAGNGNVSYIPSSGGNVLLNVPTKQ